MKSNKNIIVFLLKATLLYILWFIIYDLWLVKVGWLDNFLIQNIISTSKWLLELFNYTIFFYDQTLGIDGSHGVFIGMPCDGIELMALFTGFIILLPGRVVNKIWFSLSGLLLIHFLNILRVVILIMLAYYHPEWLDFNHKYTFTISMYIIVFLGWMLWIKKYSGKVVESHKK